MHGFDDQGSQFDHDGNLCNWWTAEDAFKYGVQVDRIVGQFNKYKVLGLNVNGKLTSGENIADLGGILASFYALNKYLEGSDIIDMSGLTARQLFFVSFAQLWRRKIRDEAAIRLLKIDPHSPNKFRVNGALTNLPEFYKQFGVVKGDKLFLSKDQRVNIF